MWFFLCVLFIFLFYLCFYVVLFVSRATWLLTQHVTKKKLNWTLLSGITLIAVMLLAICPITFLKLKCWKLSAILSVSVPKGWQIESLLLENVKHGNYRKSPMNLKIYSACYGVCKRISWGIYEGWNFNSGNYLFATDTKYIEVSKFYCPSV